MSVSSTLSPLVFLLPATKAAIVSFAPVANAGAHTLILGSIPGVASLQAREYYAHPRNAFWWIMAELLDIAPTASYEHRLKQLAGAGYVLWDVLASCERQGSLDSAIRPETVVTNDFAGLFDSYPTITRVFFNGGAAAKLWQRHVAAGLTVSPDVHQLPSTSPAYAALSAGKKCEQWRKILR